MMRNKQCCICNGYVTGKMFDPSPIKTEGKCCVVCYHTKVLPAMRGAKRIWIIRNKTEKI